MAALKLLVFISLILAGDADPSIADVHGEVKVSGSESSLPELFNSEIHSLELNIKETDEVIAAMEKIIKEKSDTILCLETELASLRVTGWASSFMYYVARKLTDTKKGKLADAEQVGKAHAKAGELEKEGEKLRKDKLDAAEQVGKAHAKAAELEKEVEKLRKDANVKIMENELLEARATEAEKRASELNSEFQYGDRMMKLRLAASEIKELMEAVFAFTKEKLVEMVRVGGACLKKWVPVVFAFTKEKLVEMVRVGGACLKKWVPVVFAFTKEKLVEMVRVGGACLKKWVPTVFAFTKEKLVEMVRVGGACLKKWVPAVFAFTEEKSVEMVRVGGACLKKWVPAVTEQLVVTSTYIQPHLLTLTTKTAEIYQASKTAATPHIIKAKEIADPYYQELRKFSKTSIDHAPGASKLYADVHTALKPYSDAFKKFLESTTTYLSQLASRGFRKYRQWGWYYLE